MTALNYIYFIILTIYAFYLLNAKRIVVKNPLNREQLLALTGPEALWILLFSTGILSLSASGAIDLSAIRMMSVELFAIVGLLYVSNKPILGFAGSAFIIFLIWAVIGLFYTSSLSFGVRTILKYIYPLLMMLFASAVVRDKEVFYKATIFARGLAIIVFIISFIPYAVSILPVFAYGTALAINFIFMMALSWAMYFFLGKRRIDLLLSLAFLIPCFVWVFRTSIAGSGIALMVFFFFKYKLRSLPIVLFIIIAGVVAVFTIPSLREKMFRDKDVTLEEFQEGKLNQDDVNDNARYMIWDNLKKHQYYGKEAIGSGTGSSQHYMYNAPRKTFGGIKVAHNEFLMILCDLGIIGLILYLLIFFFMIVHCFIVYNRKDYPVSIRLAAITSGGAIAGMIFTMYSDNTILYSMATLGYPFGFYGMMLGLLKTERET